jgi:sugar phosphate isomerase/epimerase
MVTYGFPDVELDTDLTIATRIGAKVLEILPHWNHLPDPALLRDRIADHPFTIHSAHGCWGHRTIRVNRVDLGTLDATVSRESIDDLKRCVDWLDAAGGRFLVVHPGGFSDPADLTARKSALTQALGPLADHARTAGITICVENMPPGVHPGSSMTDLFDIVESINHPALALALDTGHANLTSSVAQETLASGHRLATTHVHDNNGRQDSHEPPGHGTVDWPEWGRALDAIDYRGPIMLECVRRLRQDISLFRSDPLRGLASVAAPVD